MPVLYSKIDKNSDGFRKNRVEMLALVENVRRLEQQVHKISASKRDEFAKRGQLLPRDRLALLVDPGATFIELATLAGLGLYDDDGEEEVYGAGIIVGIGYVAGTRCMIYINDAAIKAGTNQPMTYAKLHRAQDIAHIARLPFISLMQSGGGNLLMQHLGFNQGGNRFKKQAQASAAGIPQITVVHGSSTAGGAYVPGMSDYNIFVRNQARAFLAGPPLLKAATGEIAGEEELGGAEMHAHVSGLAEFVAEDDAHAIELCREVVRQLRWNDRLLTAQQATFKPPLYDIEDLCGIVPVDYKQSYDCREIVARIADGSEFMEFKPAYDPYTICGFAEIGGQPCGIIGNNGPITNEGANKATQFIQLCCQAQRPLIFLQNTTGFIVGVDSERKGMIVNGAKWIQAVANATVPKITLIVGASFGAGNYAMCGRSFDPRFLFTWPNSKLAVMGGEQAATVMQIVYEGKQKARKKPLDQAFLDRQREEILGYYAKYSQALYCTSQVWDEGIIDPRKTRDMLIELLDICVRCEKTQLSQNTFGVARM
jgi:geranyl-CoA carboxylase beta subunit